MDKGTRVKIERGGSGKGVAGSVFWVGENKFGGGKRLGVRGDDGQTYWVNSEDVDDESAPPPPPPPTGPAPEKGDRVRWTQGGASGLGQIFWVGESKHGPGKRYGVNCDDGETRWLDQRFVEPSDEPAPAGGPPQGSGPGQDRRPSPSPAPFGGGVDDDEVDDGYIGGGGWDGSEPPDMGDDPPPPEPPADLDDEDIPF